MGYVKEKRKPRRAPSAYFTDTSAVVFDFDVVGSFFCFVFVLGGNGVSVIIFAQYKNRDSLLFYVFSF